MTITCFVVLFRQLALRLRRRSSQSERPSLFFDFLLGYQNFTNLARQFNEDQCAAKNQHRATPVIDRERVFEVKDRKHQAHELA